MKKRFRTRDACTLVLAVAASLSFEIACSSSNESNASPVDSPDAHAAPSTPSSPDDTPDDPSADASEPDTCTEPCSKDVGAHWSCDGTRRVRCVDGCVKAETCASGCEKGEDSEAVCSCGTRDEFSHWNCVTEGGRGSCAGGIGWIADACNGKSCVASPAGMSDTCASASPLQDAIQQLGLSCSTLTPGIDCSISVRDLTTNARAGFADQKLFVSASSAKVFWTAAALFDVGINAVMPYATPIFRDSDNVATTHVIELLSSSERVNTFLWQDAEVADIAFCDWGGAHAAENCPHLVGIDNYFSTGDAVAFLASLWDHSLLGLEKSTTLLDWMKLSPREGYGGWIGTQLPAAARATMHHKAGWLPPEEEPGYSNANEIGIVEIPNGHTYAVAFALNGASSQDAYETKELPLLEYLSCGVYHAVAGDSAEACDKP